MANEKHLYVVAGGDYVDAGLTGETWQVGVRCVLQPGGNPDPVGSLQNSWNVVARNTARVETNWRIDGNWTVEGGVNDLDPADWLNDQLAPAFTDWLGANLIHNIVRLQNIRVYPIGAPSGKVLAAPPYQTGTPMTLQWTGAWPVGGGSSSAMPLQNALVASHRTNQVGRRGRGRMYLPTISTIGLSSTAGSRGRLSSGTVGTALTAQRKLLEDISLDSQQGGVGIAPAIIGSPWVNYALITQIQIGDVVDTQRRRRTSLKEIRQSAEIVPF